MPRLLLFVLLLCCATTAATAQTDLTAPLECTYCEAWNEPHAPFHLFGDAYYVGTAGLSAILITTPDGHVLIDGALPQSAPLILENIRTLGFDPADVRWLLNSHAHFDHAAGLAALKHATGANLAATEWSAAVLRAGASTPDDPQFNELLPFPAVAVERILAPGDTLTLGGVTLTAHLTPGHTPGGTTWTWQACEGDRCLDMVFADSISPVSEDGFLFSDNTRYPNVLADFERAFSTIEALSCDFVISTHPTATLLFTRLAAREAGDADALVDTDACRAYAENGRKKLAERLNREG